MKILKRLFWRLVPFTAKDCAFVVKQVKQTEGNYGAKQQAALIAIEADWIIRTHKD